MEIKHKKMLRAKMEQERIDKLNQGSKDYLKQLKIEQKLQCVNRLVNNFSLKAKDADHPFNKEKVPEEARNVTDMEALLHELQTQLARFSVLNKEHKMAQSNILDATHQLDLLKRELNKVLSQKKLVIQGGIIQPELPSKEMEGAMREIQ
jgi:hypothetical protein